MTEEVKDIPVYSISPDPGQPRKNFDEISLQELADSILVNGVILPIIVSRVGNEKYQIIAGERRWRASIIAKKATIPAIIRDLEPFKRQMQALLENIQRDNLNPLEEANAYQQLLEEFELSHEEIAQAIGKSRASVTNALRLLKLPDFVQDCLRDAKLTSGHAKVLLGLADEHDIVYLAGRAVQGSWSVRQTALALEQLRNKKTFEGLDPKVGKEKFQSLQQLQLQLQSLEEAMTRYLGTSVKIQLSGNHKGNLNIQFHDFEELDRIIDLIEN